MFPRTNKIPRENTEELIEGNAKMLEQMLNQANWKVLLRYYFWGLGIFLLSLFSILAVIRLAIKI